ncbi:unnamed protein product [Prorocentrum cordatum]|uniref:Uncharacterized protein n=1 Tax=Prorocentrum cordatum TaxID=2364126 RepID=A0ABN9UU57_9DINO|nr:unnamed protein product [Polarella glacialis]
MKNGKWNDRSGVMAEMLKNGSDILHDRVLQLFNEVLWPESEPPEAWRQSRLVVIFRKGDPELHQKYRPIATLPILYQLFARMVCDRVQPVPMSKLPPEGYSTEDSLLSLILLLEKCKE